VNKSLCIGLAVFLFIQNFYEFTSNVLYFLQFLDFLMMQHFCMMMGDCSNRWRIVFMFVLFD